MRVFQLQNSDRGDHCDYSSRAPKILVTPLVRPLTSDGPQVFLKYGAWAECLVAR